jgi:hypothetical protein
MKQQFPFGIPVAPCPPSASSPRKLFVLGAYPSALHVAWVPPRPYRRVNALAVASASSAGRCPSTFHLHGVVSNRAEG